MSLNVLQFTTKVFNLNQVLPCFLLTHNEWSWCVRTQKRHKFITWSCGTASALYYLPPPTSDGTRGCKIIMQDGFPGAKHFLSPHPLTTLVKRTNSTLIASACLLVGRTPNIDRSTSSSHAGATEKMLKRSNKDKAVSARRARDKINNSFHYYGWFPLDKSNATTGWLSGSRTDESTGSTNTFSMVLLIKVIISVVIIFVLRCGEFDEGYSKKR